MLLKLDSDGSDPPGVLVVVTGTLGEHQISGDVEVVLDHLELTLESRAQPPYSGTDTSLTAHSVLPGAPSSLIP